jgi:hypothetical protein
MFSRVASLCSAAKGRRPANKAYLNSTQTLEQGKSSGGSKQIEGISALHLRGDARELAEPRRVSKSLPMPGTNFLERICPTSCAQILDRNKGTASLLSALPAREAICSKTARNVVFE